MTSRERIACSLSHREPDRTPIDIGGCGLTSMHVSTVYRLRQRLGLDEPGTPVKVVEPYQMLGEIKTDLADALGTDTVELSGGSTMFGFKNENWKEWTTFDGTPVLVPGAFTTTPDEKGDILLYPQGDTSVPPSGRMPKDGWYFDAIVRQGPIDDNALHAEDNTEEFTLLSENDLGYVRQNAAKLYLESDRAIIGGVPGASFGDIAHVPAPSLKTPKGIRDIEEWYVSTTTRKELVYAIFEKQCEVALQNLTKLYDAVGDRVQVVVVTGTDFGMQTGPFISPQKYRDLYKPFHTSINRWIHAHTPWKTFIHSCGSVYAFIEDFIDAGFDILNPVQCSAANMDPKLLKEKFGDRITFWGGGVDTQHTLPFGTPDDVRREVAERISIFGKGGGFVFAAIHNIQARTPVENIIAMMDVVHGRG
jgi:uroporphyrinogen-III decarboxylase